MYFVFHIPANVSAYFELCKKHTKSGSKGRFGGRGDLFFFGRGNEGLTVMCMSSGGIFRTFVHYCTIVDFTHIVHF